MLVAVVTSTPMFTGPAMAGAEARTTVTIKGPNGDFHGKIKSPDDGCVGDRVVRLFMSDNAEGPFDGRATPTRRSRTATSVSGR